ncbi:MAG: adenylate/guanylate cyclase domain-containing protein [Turneriella sp.]
MIGTESFRLMSPGDTVNTASRMEELSAPEMINISRSTAAHGQDYFEVNTGANWWRKIKARSTCISSNASRAGTPPMPLGIMPNARLLRFAWAHAHGGAGGE